MEILKTLYQQRYINFYIDSNPYQLPSLNYYNSSKRHSRPSPRLNS
jgi:hypothetical protein